MFDRNFILKWIIFAGVITASLVIVTPVKEKIRLGLDLAGGTSFTVQIDEEQLRHDIRQKFEDEKKTVTDAEIEAEVKRSLEGADERTIEVLRNRIDGLGVNEPLIVPGKDHRIIIEIPGASSEQQQIAEKSIKSAAYLQFRLVHPESGILAQKLINSGKAPEGYEIYDAPEGGLYYRRTAEYEKLVSDPGYKRRLEQFGSPPARHVFMLELQRLRNGLEVYTPAFVNKREEMNGNNLKKADISTDGTTGAITVSLSFSKEGAREFGKVTSEYCKGGAKNRNGAEGRQLAIILDGTLYSSPVIRSAITTGRAEISGNFNRADAAQLRNVLNAGSLPAPIKILEKRSIDPSLGQDAIDSGIRASIIGGLLVVIFMALYYCFLGGVADIALVLNIALLPLGAILVSGFFGAIGATDAVSGARTGLQLPVLTMPGIAGIVLTIGMAVDANVLIFERIREEMQAGKSTLAAVASGFDRAFLAIFDSNLTTFLTAIILFIFGSGPIRGFAITLSAGIVVSMYTALVVTRMILKLIVTEKTKKLKIMDWFRFEKVYDFVGKGRLAFTVSAAIIVITLAIFAIRCKTNAREVMAIDFTGGTVMTYTFDKEKTPATGAIREALRAGGIDDAIIQPQISSDNESKSIEIKSGYEKVNGGIEIGQAITTTLEKAFPESGMVLKGQDTIGSQIGSDLKRDATKAVIFALIGMLIYISVRFEFGFALGAVVALLHDVLITLGLFTLFQRQIGVTAIACFLTIVGYSVNDTIVIFDRIREDIKRNPNMQLSELCNRSISVTLGRTVITSVTTFLAVLALLIFGGGAIFDFALCMTLGIVAGVYSTIFIATPVMIAWYRGRRPGMAKKERM